MAGRDIFTKLIPNVKLATRFNADGQEILVENREDAEADRKEKEIFELLVNAGYYRARIKGLSSFDKIVGGMAWCIECCDFDVDVDCLFQENFTIGQKIALVEKIVAVLPQMKCPYILEPHQIQGLEYISIHPVIDWLVKTSVESRIERSHCLKRFANTQFHHTYQFQSDKAQLLKIRNASGNIKNIQEKFSAGHQFQPNDVSSKNDDITRVRTTLAEYGHNLKNMKMLTTNNEILANRELEEETIDNLLKKMSLVKKNTLDESGKILNSTQREILQKHYQDFREEMEVDTKYLSEKYNIKQLKESKESVNNNINESEIIIKELENQVKNEEEIIQNINGFIEETKEKLHEFGVIKSKADTRYLNLITPLIQKHDELKSEESEFKEFCRADLESLQKELDALEKLNSQSPKEQEQTVYKERARIKELRLQIAKRYRGIIAIERKLDAIPDRTELAQYQRRFHELYNEMSAKHLETKQYFILFNILNDQKRYMKKELSLLNSICEAYNVGMLSQHGREDFIKQFESIAAGVKQTEDKIRHKFNEERLKRDNLNEEMLALVELQRQYAIAVKQLSKECYHCEHLKNYLHSIRK